MRPWHPEQSHPGKWKRDTWSVIHHFEDGTSETVHLNTAGHALSHDEAAIEVHRFTSEDPKSKARTVVLKNGKLHYQRFWNKKAGQWAKTIEKRQKRAIEKARNRGRKTPLA